MYLSVGNIADIVLAIFFIIEILQGRNMGLALQAARLVVLFVSLVAAQVLSGIVGIPMSAGVFFVIAFAVFWKIAKIVKIVDWIPVVGTLDKFGGAVAGFCTAFLVCYFLFFFLGTVIPQRVWNGWGLTQEVVDKTYLLQAFLR